MVFIYDVLYMIIYVISKVKGEQMASCNKSNRSNYKIILKSVYSTRNEWNYYMAYCMYTSEEIWEIPYQVIS
jgi:hypothetical protein